jgi:hypothetical protein
MDSSSVSDEFRCDCGEVYCSAECGLEAFNRHHYCLCVATMFGEAVAEFKFYCLSVEGCGDNLLLLSQLLAILAKKSEGSHSSFQSSITDIMTYTNRPFNEVARPPSGSERDDDWEEWLEETILTAFKLLKKALSPQNEIFKQFFTNESEAFSICSRILSIFELNNIDIAIPTQLGVELQSLYLSSDASTRLKLLSILQEKEIVMRALWNDEAQGIYEDEEELEMDHDDEGTDERCHDDEEGHNEEAITAMLDEIREAVISLSADELLSVECPTFHGTGFYLSVARTNHSCEPNVQMDFDDLNCTVSCKALRSIAAGEELRMSYISRPDEKSVQLRRSQLWDYLFQCACRKCESEWSQKIFHAM